MFDQIIAFLHSHLLESILIAALAVSEGLAQIPSVQANSIFQAVKNGIKFIKDKLFPPAI